MCGRISRRIKYHIEKIKLSEDKRPRGHILTFMYYDDCLGNLRRCLRGHIFVRYYGFNLTDLFNISSSQKFAIPIHRLSKLKVSGVCDSLCT